MNKTSKTKERMSTDPKPAQKFIKFETGGRPYIEGKRCRSCAAVMTSEPLACPACGAREGYDSFRAAETGVLHAYSIVARSYPGVATPFVSAIVDLDDGLTLKGNLINIPPTPETITPGMKLRVTFDDALGRTDKEGGSYIAYFFEPAEQGA